MKYIFIFFIVVALIWGGWKYVYTPYQIKKAAETQLANREIDAKKELAEQVAKADFSVIMPTPPKGYYLVGDSDLARAREAAAQYYKSKIFGFDYQNANKMLLTVNERLFKDGEAAKSFYEEKENQWDSTAENKLTDGTVVYSARKITKYSIPIPQGGTFNMALEMAVVRFGVGKILVNIETTSASSSGHGQLLSDKELIQFANSFIK